MSSAKILVQSLSFPSEIVSVFKLKFGGTIKKTHDSWSLEECAQKLDNHDFCYEVLNRVSRSFAVVIQQLPEKLKDAVCVFYLVLRGLDSVEDDMTYDVKSKIPLLQTFYEKLEIDGWSIENVGDSKDYRTLLKYFGKVISVYKALDKGYRDAISEITRLMGCGMAEYADKPGSLKTLEEYDQYCHYVAGLVGYGLSDLFSASGLEDPNLKDEKKISNAMGLFLQKTNIIRDYLEDLDDGRTWWPEEIWSQYADNLDDFKKKPDDQKSIDCLNRMVADALVLVPHCLTYLKKLKTPSIFSFCAIPQVMALATLEKVYDNPDVFKGNVKVRKGLSCKMMMQCKNMQQVNNWFNGFASKLERRAGLIHDETITSLAVTIQSQTPPSFRMKYTTLREMHFFALCLFIWGLFVNYGKLFGPNAITFELNDYLMVATTLFCGAFVFNFFSRSAF